MLDGRALRNLDNCCITQTTHKLKGQSALAAALPPGPPLTTRNKQTGANAILLAFKWVHIL